MPILPSFKGLIFLNTSDYGAVLEYKHFLAFLKDKHIKGVDRWKEIKKSNVDHKLKADLINLNGTEYLNLTSVIGFAYHHRDILQVCKDITNDIEGHLLKCSLIPKEGEVFRKIQSVKEVYNLVAQVDFTKHLKDLIVSSTFTVKTADSLYQAYQPDFTCDQWDRIKFFEHHFNKRYPKCTSRSIDEQIKLKYAFLKEYQETKELCENLKEQHKQTTKDRKERKTETDIVNGIYIKGNSRHLPNIIDSEITSLIAETQFHHNDFAFVVNCSGFCKHQQGLHVLVATDKASSKNDLNDLGTAIITTLSRSHHDNFVEVVFLSTEGVLLYVNDYGVTRRFHLFDDICQGKLSEHIIHVYHPSDVTDEREEDIEKCQKCFSSYSLEPLHWKTLDITQEWFLDVPLLMQVILESFLNEESLSRSTQIDDFERGKITRLYAIYDSLLQVSNRMHIGVIQELNTKELIYNYHNVTTVFSITSKAGATRCMSSADKQLKRNSDADQLYWDSYIREHPIEYDTDAGKITKSVRLRDCYLVLGLDNLVRLTFKRDPERGQTKSNQICTLPITLKGIPTDSASISSWHLEELCDGEDVCPCKRQKTLGRTDFETKILKDTAEEQNTTKRFTNFMTWGLKTLWESVFEHGDVMNVNGFEREKEDINISFDALSLNEHEHHRLITKDETLLEQDHDQKSADEQGTEDDIEGNISDVSSIADSTDLGFCPLPVSDEEDNITTDDETGDEFSRYEDVEEGELERSIIQNFVPLASHFHDTEVDKTRVDTIQSPFHIFEPPPYIEKHPPPADGRDDDILKLKEVLEDVTTKSGKSCISNPNAERILLAPDHKIGNNLIKLIKENPKFRIFLPEFPLLHLRKSKIINLCSAYKSAGLTQMLMYMHDEDNDTDWLKLISINNIEVATRNIRRLSMTFHVVMMTLFLESLDDQDLLKLKNHLVGSSTVTADVEEKYANFIEMKRQDSATFALHLDIMQHCDEIVAIYMAERVGGEDGYKLLLSAVKTSLPFAFLNGASSYAAFCMQLLNEHYSAGPFWQSMKMSLFSTKHKNSNVNIALDTQREMDHRDALRGFRPRAGLSAILPRMSLVDMFDDVHSALSSVFEKTTLKDEFLEQDHVDIFKITKKDISHVLPTAKMMTERLKIASSSGCGEAPHNIYSSEQEILTECFLDKNTICLGHVLMYRYAVKEKMFGLTTDDIPPLPDHSPKELLQKVKNTKGTTVQRATCKAKPSVMTRDVMEKKRQNKVQKMKKTYDCMSSEMNMCQALLKPDCSKAVVPKSLGMKTALLSLVEECMRTGNNEDATGRQITMTEFYMDSNIPSDSTHTVKLMVIEFAGVKFNVPERGVCYLDFVKKNIFGKLRCLFPSTNHIIVCEEKYKYTPDDFKSATRSNRKAHAKSSISHLKPAADILSAETFNRKAVTTTMEGKQMISKYLASNIDKLVLLNLTVDIDSELHIEGCDCGNERACNCPSYATPIRAEYGSHGLQKSEKLHDIKQRKGEAEMSQLDWIIKAENISDGEAVLSVVTSGDIDSLVIHLFTISRMWPRNEDGDFKNQVFLLLQKPNKKFDFYCVTNIIKLLERKYGRGCCTTIAVLLCIGGNDFLPKFSGKSHSTVLKAGLSRGKIPDLFNIHDTGDQVTGTVNEDEYFHLMKVLYCPKTFDVNHLTLHEVRQLSIRSPGKDDFNSPDKWMPPQSALLKMIQLVNCQIDYLLTAGNSEAPLPRFLSYGCLKRSESGETEYDFGPEVKTQTKTSLLTIPENQLNASLVAARISRRKRGAADTPQKGQRRKRRPPASTPRKLGMGKF